LERKIFSAIMLTMLLTSMLTLILNIQPGKAEARTWTVDDDGPADFHMIQEAINVASDGDTIFVHNGTYHETVTVNSNLSLVGENRIGTIIDGNATDAGFGLWSKPVVELAASSNLTGFTIQNGGWGVQVSSIFPWLVPTFTGHRIENNQIVSNLCGAILLKGCANNTVSDNFIANNTLTGIHLWNAGNNTITNNAIVHNGYGIDLYGNSNDNILRNNNMTDNEYNFGPILRGDTWAFLGIPLDHAELGLCNDVDSSNTVNGKPIYCWVSRGNDEVPSDAGYIWLNNCTDITVNQANLSDNLQGIILQSTNNTSISNCTITNNACGIYLWDSTNNMIVGNTLKDNLNGIYLGDFSKSTTMRNNSINGGEMNFGIPMETYRSSPYPDPSGPLIEFMNDIDISNTVEGTPIIYWTNQINRKVPTNVGCVILINCTNILVEGLNLSKNVQGVYALASNNTIITNNSLSDTIYGIDVKDIFYLYNESMRVYYVSFNTTIQGNILDDNGVGMRIRSDSSTITNNTVLRNPLGCLTATSGSLISSNVVVGSDISLIPQSWGPYLDYFFPETPWERSYELSMYEIGGIFVGGDFNLVQGNTVSDSYVGISTNELVRSIYGSGNLIFHNNLINDTYAAGQSFPRGTNFWNAEYPSGGNYWSDHSGTDLYSGPYQNETGSDGIGDTPYIIQGVPVNNTDRYALMAPFSTFSVTAGSKGATDIGVTTNSTVSDVEIDEAAMTLSLNVSGVNGTFGHCRIALPNSVAGGLWHGNYTVLLNGQPWPFRNWTDAENTYIYINYTHSEHQIAIVQEFPSFLILPLFFIATLLAVIVYKRKRVGSM
jgi:parallel beta-helix repeat protein